MRAIAAMIVVVVIGLGVVMSGCQKSKHHSASSQSATKPADAKGGAAKPGVASKPTSSEGR
jgi:hypothetical protein